jgi:alkyl sulfatase BDS1-like metallo-beta-lactamase superfamily hydrolase
VVNDEEIAPKGADATVKLMAEKESGKFTGRTELTVAHIDHLGGVKGR